MSVKIRVPKTTKKPIKKNVKPLAYQKHKHTILGKNPKEIYDNYGVNDWDKIKVLLDEIKKRYEDIYYHTRIMIPKELLKLFHPTYAIEGGLVIAPPTENEFGCEWRITKQFDNYVILRPKIHFIGGKDKYDEIVEKSLYYLSVILNNLNPYKYPTRIVIMDTYGNAYKELWNQIKVENVLDPIYMT